MFKNKKENPDVLGALVKGWLLSENRDKLYLIHNTFKIQTYVRCKNYE